MLRLLAVIVTANAVIKDCDPASVFRPTELGLLPETPVAGQPVRMTVKFDNPGPVVTDGTATTTLTYNFLPFSPTVEPLCANTACPLAEGPNDRSATTTWPTGLSGTLVSKSQWTGAEGQSLLCVQTTVKVGSPRLRGNLDVNSTQMGNPWLRSKALSAWYIKNLEYSNTTCPAVDLLA